MTRPQQETRTALWSFERVRLQAPGRSVGGACAGLLLGTALAAGAGEPVPAPPAASDSANAQAADPAEPEPVLPLLMPPDTVNLLPPTESDTPAGTVQKTNSGPRTAEPKAAPQAEQPIPIPLLSGDDVPATQRPSDPIVERAELLQRDKEQRYERLRGQLKDLIARWKEQQQRLREMQGGAAPDGRESASEEGAGSSGEAGSPGKTGSPGENAVPESPLSQSPRSVPSPSEPGTSSEPQGANPLAAMTPETQTPRSAPGQPPLPTDIGGMAPGTPAAPEPAPDRSMGIPGFDGEFSDPVVAEGPIDRLGLADSLFASGEVELALELYLQLEVDSRSLDELDRYWVSYQIGCCYRRLNNLDEAQKRYRGVIADRNSGWVGDLAKWWLDHLEERARLRDQIQGLQQTMRALEKQVNEQLSTAD